MWDVRDIVLRLLGRSRRRVMPEPEPAPEQPSSAPAAPGVQRFVDDDESYMAWLAAYPGGFVVSVERRPRASYVILHRATCRTINGVPTRGDTWTGEYVKWCGDLPDLEAYVRAQVGGSPRPCGICHPAS